MRSAPLELKFYKTALVPTAFTWSGTTTSVVGGITRGDAANQFDGNKLMPAGLTIRLSMYQNSASALTRFIVVQVVKGTAPLASELIDTINSANTPLQPYNRGYKPTVKVLFDEIIPVFPTGQSVQVRQIYIKGKRMKPIEFITGTTNISTGDIRMYWYSDIAAAGPNIAFTSELLYAD